MRPDRKMPRPAKIFVRPDKKYRARTKKYEKHFTTNTNHRSMHCINNLFV
jgi:hypothetical protein